MATAYSIPPSEACAPVVAVGFQNLRQVADMERTAGDAGATLAFAPSLGDVRKVLEQAPAAVVIDASAASAEEACLMVRSDPERACTPIVVVSDDVSDLAFQEVFGWGADDLVDASRPAALERRLRAGLAARVAATPRRGGAVVADPDRRARVLYARVLRGAGYDVSFAVDAAEALRQAGRPDVELVVCSSTFELGSDGLGAAARSAESAARWVVSSSPRDFARCRAKLTGLAAASVHDAFSPPENLLFVANELEARRGVDARATARLLYGTTIRFQSAGADHDELGYSYNVSAGGMYVRTLAPQPPLAEVWFEFRPPRCDRFVRLEAQVMWSRPFGSAARAVVPPGFGVQFTGGSAGDIARYEDGCKAFEDQLLG